MNSIKNKSDIFAHFNTGSNVCTYQSEIQERDTETIEPHVPKAPLNFNVFRVAIH